MKDKGVATGGVPAKASAKRSARSKKPEAAVERGDRVAAAAPQSAMQAFRSAVKKAANKMKGRKPRR
jgi:ribonuclease R